MPIPDVLSGRKINWCEDGNGFHPYCPTPSDPDEYVYCCNYFYLGDDKPSCCRFPMHTGLLIALIISAIFLAFLLVFLYCWFCPTSRLNGRRNRDYVRPR